MEDNSQFNISPLYSLGFVTEIFWEPDIGVRNRSQVGQTRVGYSAERIGKFKFFMIVGLNAETLRRAVSDLVLNAIFICDSLLTEVCKDMEL